MTEPTKTSREMGTDKAREFVLLFTLYLNIQG